MWITCGFCPVRSADKETIDALILARTWAHTSPAQLVVYEPLGDSETEGVKKGGKVSRTTADVKKNQTRG